MGGACTCILETPGETLWAVIIGALLATVGGFVATQFERMMHRRERERNAALVCGGVLSALDALTDVARGRDGARRAVWAADDAPVARHAPRDRGL